MMNDTVRFYLYGFYSLIFFGMSIAIFFIDFGLIKPSGGVGLILFFASFFSAGENGWIGNLIFSTITFVSGCYCFYKAVIFKD